MANLPLVEWAQAKTQWSSLLNPVIATPIVNGVQLKVALKTGSNVINHTLQRKMQGWFIVDIDAAVTVYRPALSPFNKLTLTLVASGAANCELWVY